MADRKAETRRNGQLKALDSKAEDRAMGGSPGRNFDRQSDRGFKAGEAAKLSRMRLPYRIYPRWNRTTPGLLQPFSS